MGYEHDFLRAADELKGSDLQISDSQKIKLYGLYKQATEGDCHKSEPSVFQPVERAKWNGWHSLKGMESIEAKRQYVMHVIEIMPSFRVSMTESDRGISTQSTINAEESTLSSPFSTVTRQTPAMRQRVSHIAQSSRTRSLPNLVPQNRQTETISSLPMAMIVLEVVGLFVGIALVVVICIKIFLPLCNVVAPTYFGIESCRPVKSLSPLIWFGMGYLFVGSVRSKMFAWRVLRGEFVWLSATAPVRRLRQNHRSHLNDGQIITEQDSTMRLLNELGIHLVSTPKNEQDQWMTPRVELVLPNDPESLSVCHTTVEIPFSLEQTVHVYYRKFKLPLPDPANPMLVAIEDEAENVLHEWDAVYRRRVLRLTNSAPYVIKRFVNVEFIDNEEHSLFDKRNRVFYVYTKNRSLQSLGIVEDYAIYQAMEGNPTRTVLTHSARLHITNASVPGFIRSQCESIIATGYAKQAPLSREYLVQRLVEEFGPTYDENETFE